MTKSQRPMHEVLVEQALERGVGYVVELGDERQIAQLLAEMFHGDVRVLIGDLTASEAAAELVRKVLEALVAGRQAASRFAIKPPLYPHWEALERLLRIIGTHEDPELLRRLGLGRNARDLLHHYFPRIIKVASQRVFIPRRERDKGTLRSIHVRLLWAYWLTDGFVNPMTDWLAAEAPETGEAANQTAGGAFVKHEARFRFPRWVSSYRSDWLMNLDQDQAAALWDHSYQGHSDFREVFARGWKPHWSKKYGPKGPKQLDARTDLVTEAFFGFLLMIFDEREDERARQPDKTAECA